MKYHAPYALLPDGWSASVAIDIDDAGTIQGVNAAADAARCERLAGPVVPAMPNLHSHAFQRALAGRTGRAAANHDDSFWSWRSVMYELVGRLDPDAVEAIAAQAYVEMAKAGYACVAEFHYLHHDPEGDPYADPAELALRVVAAAQTAGLRLTLLPVFYAHAGFGGQPPAREQRRFVHALDSFARLLDALRAHASHFTLGVAPHSLRAVTREELLQVVRMVEPGAPIHIHAAEQTREVDECYAATGMRPVEWLLAYARLDERWCVVHATHMTEREIAGLAASDAVAGLAPTTESDLGDGAFPGVAYLAAGGRFGVGSDSNTAISPFAELRQLEWSQRVRTHRRNVLATDGATIGTGLWQRAAMGGAQALAQPVGAIAPGRRADLVVLNELDPALALQAPENLLDAAIFGPAVAPVRDLIVAGRFVVREGRHPREEAVLARYRDTLRRLG
ncbi:MAG: formimidoylglutamate deiminase [Burkholderiales bacterium]|nr:formimidoylglutamate deiminase [Burkholderiales bacterium]